MFQGGYLLYIIGKLNILRKEKQIKIKIQIMKMSTFLVRNKEANLKSSEMRTVVSRYDSSIPCNCSK